MCRVPVIKPISYQCGRAESPAIYTSYEDALCYAFDDVGRHLCFGPDANLKEGRSIDTVLDDSKQDKFIYNV